jgi:cytochrome c oxidase cbb3-type subunit 3
MADNKRMDQPTGTETVGHEWDGIEELNTPLPRWWLWTFYATIAWGIAYSILFPAWPMLHAATTGVFGWSSRNQFAEQMATNDKLLAPIHQAVAATDIEKLPANPRLWQAAIEGGRAAFKVHCVQCHGSGAAGSKGYPNLNDDDWLWGGDLKAIEYSIMHGIRNPDHDETRVSQMPAFGRDGMLTPAQIGDIASYVRTVSRQQPATRASTRGTELFAANCAICHATDARGNRELGAPDLTDAIWLYGGDHDTIIATITNSRNGVMPRWGGKLSPTTIKMLAAYVHSLGGGEATPQAALAASATPGTPTNVQP